MYMCSWVTRSVAGRSMLPISELAIKIRFLVIVPARCHAPANSCIVRARDALAGIKQVGHQFAGGLLAGTAHQIGSSRRRASMPSSRSDLAMTLLIVPPAISSAKASTSVLVAAN